MRLYLVVRLIKKYVIVFAAALCVIYSLHNTLQSHRQTADSDLGGDIANVKDRDLGGDIANVKDRGASESNSTTIYLRKEDNNARDHEGHIDDGRNIGNVQNKHSNSRIYNDDTNLNEHVNNGVNSNTDNEGVLKNDGEVPKVIKKKRVHHKKAVKMKSIVDELIDKDIGGHEADKGHLPRLVKAKGYNKDDARHVGDLIPPAVEETKHTNVHKLRPVETEEEPEVDPVYVQLRDGEGK